MGPVGCPETSVRNYNYSPCNNPVESSSHLLCGGSSKSRIGERQFHETPSSIVEPFTTPRALRNLKICTVRAGLPGMLKCCRRNYPPKLI